MKLYLSSYRVPTPDDLLNLLPSEPSKTKVVIIANAKDYLIPRARTVKLKAINTFLQKLGFDDMREVDLRDYDDSAQLKKDLEEANMIWVVGGNTFCLIEQVRNSGFDQIIQGLLEKGIVYCGESAGAVIAGSSLRGVELDDEPEFAEKIIWDGLGLIDKFILPHADNKFYQNSNEQSKQLYSADDVVRLNDNQALIVNNTTQKIATGKS